MTDSLFPPISVNTFQRVKGLRTGPHPCPGPQGQQSPMVQYVGSGANLPGLKSCLHLRDPQFPHLSNGVIVMPALPSNATQFNKPSYVKHWNRCSESPARLRRSCLQGLTQVSSPLPSHLHGRASFPAPSPHHSRRRKATPQVS